MESGARKVKQDDSKPPRTLRVAVVEDDKVVRAFIERLLGKPEHNCQFVGAWADAETALRELPDFEPDVVVVDLELPQMSGAELISVLSRKMISAAFVVLTVHDDPAKVFAALRAGAHGYLLKGAKPEDIVGGIRSASEGGPRSARRSPGCSSNPSRNRPRRRSLPFPVSPRGRPRSWNAWRRVWCPRKSPSSSH